MRLYPVVSYPLAGGCAALLSIWVQNDYVWMLSLGNMLVWHASCACKLAVCCFQCTKGSDFCFSLVVKVSSSCSSTFGEFSLLKRMWLLLDTSEGVLWLCSALRKWRPPKFWDAVLLGRQRKTKSMATNTICAAASCWEVRRGLPLLPCVQGLWISGR